MKQNQSIIISVVIVLSVTLFSINLIIHHATLWLLLLIPALRLIMLFPNWRSALLIGLGVFLSPILGEYYVHHSQGSFTTDHFITLVLNSVVGCILYLFVAYFRIQIEKLTQELRLLSLIDPLTKIHNRRYFNMILERELALANRNHSSLLLIIFDIDHFKKLNDTYGHNFGDKVLKELSKVGRLTIRGTDTFTRIGGEEFAILLPNTSIEQGYEVAERIRKTIEAMPVLFNNEKVKITVSLGLSKYNGCSAEEFLKMADRVLYKAKENGRNQVQIINRSV